MRNQPQIVGISPAPTVKVLADGLALVYHEARHVRHLIRGGHLSTTGWERLLSLPTNRVEAWRAIQSVRAAAAEAPTTDRATRRFEERFSKSLADIQDLYANGHWKHSATVGGHAWRGVTAAVIALRDAIERGAAGEVEGAASALLNARHNNGALRGKITELDGALGIETGPWWYQAASR